MQGRVRKGGKQEGGRAGWMLAALSVVLQRAAESRGTEPPRPAEDVSATQCKQGARVLVIEGPDQLGFLKRREGQPTNRLAVPRRAVTLEGSWPPGPGTNHRPGQWLL